MREEPEFNYRDQDGIWHNSPQMYLWTNVLGGCGCGSSEDLADRAWDLLRFLAEDPTTRDYSIFYDDLANETIAHWMHSKGLIQHGASIAGSWLADDGIKLFRFMANWKPE